MTEEDRAQLQYIEQWRKKKEAKKQARKSLWKRIKILWGGKRK